MQQIFNQDSPFIFLAIRPQRSGKTYCLKYIFSKIVSKFDYGFVFSKISFNGDYDWIPPQKSFFNNKPKLHKRKRKKFKQPTLLSLNLICHIANYYQEFSNYLPKIDFNELENKSTEELTMFLTHLQYLVNIKNQPSVSGESVYNIINIAEVLLNIYFPKLKLNGIGKYLRNEKTDKLIKEYMLFNKQISFVHPIEKLLTSIIQETYGYIAMGGTSPHIPPDINKNVTNGGQPHIPSFANKNVTNSETQTEIKPDLLSQLKNFGGTSPSNTDESEKSD